MRKTQKQGWACLSASHQGACDVDFYNFVMDLDHLSGRGGAEVDSGARAACVRRRRGQEDQVRPHGSDLALLRAPGMASPPAPASVGGAWLRPGACGTVAPVPVGGARLRLSAVPVCA